MAVKELRQGLRTRRFAGVMLVLHALMVIVTLMGGGTGNEEGISGLADGIVTFVLCIILPAPALHALANEIKANTMETLVLTELSAGRIVFGKWASMAIQSLVVAVSLMPYVVARYVFGGLDLFSELGTLGAKWLVGAVVGAFLMCISTQKQAWLRSIVGGLFSLTIGMMIIGTLMPRFIGGSFPASGMPWTLFLAGTSGAVAVLVVSVAATWAIFSLLSVASTRIAPSASNLALIKRTVHLVAFIGVGALASGPAPTSVVASAMVFVLMVASIDALTERVNDVPSVYAPFYRRGWLGRIASWFFVPGWNTGIVFSLLLTVMGSTLLWWKAGIDSASTLWLAAAVIWMPAALIQLTPSRRAPDLLGPWIVYYLVCGFLTMLVGFTFPFASAMSITPWLAGALPSTVMAGVKMAKAGEADKLRLCGLAVASLWPLLLLISSLFAARFTRETKREARLMAAQTEPA